MRNKRNKALRKKKGVEIDLERKMMSDELKKIRISMRKLRRQNKHLAFSVNNQDSKKPKQKQNKELKKPKKKKNKDSNQSKQMQLIETKQSKNPNAHSIKLKKKKNGKVAKNRLQMKRQKSFLKTNKKSGNRFEKI